MIKLILNNYRNLKFEYFEAEDESGDSYGMDFNFEELSKLIQ